MAKRRNLKLAEPKGIELRTLIGQNFATALQRLSECEPTAETKFVLKRILKLQIEYSRDYEEERQALVRQYAEKDENGEPLTDEVDVPEFTKDGKLEIRKQKEVRFSPENRKLVDEKVKELLAVKAAVPTVTVKGFKHLDKVTPFDLVMLDGVLLED